MKKHFVAACGVSEAASLEVLLVVQLCIDTVLCSAFCLTLLHSERPKLYGVLAILSVIGLNVYKQDNCHCARHSNRKVLFEGTTLV